MGQYPVSRSYSNGGRSFQLAERQVVHITHVFERSSSRSQAAYVDNTIWQRRCGDVPLYLRGRWQQPIRRSFPKVIADHREQWTFDDLTSRDSALTVLRTQICLGQVRWIESRPLTL